MIAVVTEPHIHEFPRLLSRVRGRNSLYKWDTTIIPHKMIVSAIMTLFLFQIAMLVA